VQIVIADVDANGRALSTSTSFALSGQVRAQGEGDDSLNRLATKAGRKLVLHAMKLKLTGPVLAFFKVLRNVWSYQK
jgi:ribosomal S21e-like protein